MLALVYNTRVRTIRGETLLLYLWFIVRSIIKTTIDIEASVAYHGPCYYRISSWLYYNEAKFRRTSFAYRGPCCYLCLLLRGPSGWSWVAMRTSIRLSNHEETSGKLLYIILIFPLSVIWERDYGKRRM